MHFRKPKYYLDFNSLTYKKEEVWTRRNMLIIGVIFLLVMFISVAIAKLVLSFYNTPKEQILIVENKVLKDKYKAVELKLQSFNKSIDTLNAIDDSIYRAILGLKAVEQPIRKAGIGGRSMVSEYGSENSKQILETTANQIKLLEAKMAISKKSYAEVLEYSKANQKRLKHIPAIMPISNKSLKRTGSGFGMRFHPILNITRMHEGQDFIAPKGTRIYATGNAIVKQKYLSKTFGKVLILDHGYGFETYYAHLSNYNVKEGEKVERGDLIGFMGSTGLSSGSHLHYEVHLNGKEVDPVNYFYNDLSPEQYNAIVKIANSYTSSMD